MFRSQALSAAVVCLSLVLPASLFARATMHWYPPHYATSVDESSNRLQFISPHFAPITADENLTTGYTLQRFDVSRLGINLSFTKSGVNQSSQYYWSWWGGYVAPVTTPFKDDIVTSVVYSDVSYFEIYNNETSAAASFPATWCVDYIHRGSAAGNSTICVPTEADAHALIDALGTLVVASGGSMEISPGVTVKPSSDKEFRNHPERAGMEVTRMDSDGPPALAGIRNGDIIHSMNGKLCTGAKEFLDDFNKAVRASPEAGIVHLEVIHKGNSTVLDLHYPNPDAGVALLRQKSAESARHPVGSVVVPPEAGQTAPPAPGRFGFLVRAVTDADVAPLSLPKPRGIVVVSVDKGGWAEGMGIQNGDVILEVNDSEIGDLQFFTQFLRSGAAKKFRVWRKGQAIQMVLPESL